MKLVSNSKMDMDMVIPLNLNLNKKNIRNSSDSNNTGVTTNQSLSPSKPILGREQAKKRLLAFAQQWNRTRDNLHADKSFQSIQDSHGTLKYTYVVEGEDGREISFPANIIQYTNTEPRISFCENPHYATGVFQSRKEILEVADDDIRQAMYFIMNSMSPYCQNREFTGRSRKWYADKNTFIGKPSDETDDKPACSPNWESDSEEESNRNYNDFETDFLPKTLPSILDTQVVSKVKINKVELPFFEDDDFLNSIMASVSSHNRLIKQEKSDSESHRDQHQGIKNEYSAFMDNFGNSRRENNHEIKPNESPTLSDEWKVEGSSKTQNDFHFNENRKRPASPDWDQQWRSSRYRRYNDRSRRSSSLSPRQGKTPRTPDENETKDDDEYYNGRQSSRLEESDEVAIDTKRISLDERLELELGIKMESEHNTSSMFSPQSNDQYSSEISPLKRKRGFGPKAAPLGSLIFSCPKALPATPYIPPHLQSLLYQPLTVRTVPPKLEDEKTSNALENDSEDKQNDTQSEGSEKKSQKDWDKELKNLEAVATNLEAADETVLEALEEKLLQFETTNILQSGGNSPTSEVKDEQTKAIKKAKRPKPPPIDLKEAGKGILVMPRVSLLDETSGQQKKNVMFADNVRPGYGTSSDEDEEYVRSPPPPVPQPVAPVESSPNKKFKKRKKEKFVGDDFDPVFDLLPPPPPPPGSPPPHLPQGRSPTPTPVPPSTAVDSFVASPPQAIESGAC